MIALTRNKLFTVIYCLLVAAWASTLVATAGAEESLPSKTVRYSDLDISKPEGAKALYQRIRAAARDVCDLSIAGDPVLRAATQACVDTAIDNAVRKVDAPALTSLRFGGDIRLASK
ncbi:MAG TPA: UrcA family protein [Steroidobacteraceae bacterium]